MDTKKGVAIIIVCIAVVITGGWILGIAPGNDHGPLEPVTVGTPLIEQSALIFIADDRGYFHNNGLNVTIKPYSAGLYAVKGLTVGETDLSTASEYVFMQNALKNANISAVANIDSYTGISIIGRIDRGINTYADLSGKKIGLTHGTVNQFYIGRYLELHGIPLSRVTLTDIQPDHLAVALNNGDVDAVIACEPYAYEITKGLGRNALVLSAQSGQQAFWLLVAQDTWMADHSETLNKFLTSLLQAQEYAATHPAEAQAIVQKRMGTSNFYIKSIWPQNSFALSLDQSLLLAMEDETRWMMSNNLTNQTDMPNYLDYVETQSLRAVQPRAMNIIK